MPSSTTHCYCVICSEFHDRGVGSAKDMVQSDMTARNPHYICDRLPHTAVLDHLYDDDDDDDDYDSDDTCCGEECLEEWGDYQGEELYTGALEHRLNPFGLDDILECEEEEEEEFDFQRLDLDGASLFEDYDLENPL